MVAPIISGSAPAPVPVLAIFTTESMTGADVPLARVRIKTTLSSSLTAPVEAVVASAESDQPRSGSSSIDSVSRHSCSNEFDHIDNTILCRIRRPIEVVLGCAVGGHHGLPRAEAPRGRLHGEGFGLVEQAGPFSSVGIPEIGFSSGWVVH